MENSKSAPKAFVDPTLKWHLDKIKTFLENYDLDGSEVILWDMLLYAFTCKDADNWDGFRRNNTMLFYKLTLGLIQAIWAIAIPMFNHFQHELPFNLEHIKINTNE